MRSMLVMYSDIAVTMVFILARLKAILELAFLCTSCVRKVVQVAHNGLRSHHHGSIHRQDCGLITR